MNAIINIQPVFETTPGTVRWNKDTIKAHIDNDLGKYAGAVVTDQNLTDMEKAYREIVSYRTTITRFRAFGRRKLKEPMDDFSKECDDILNLIDSYEHPMAVQLKAYDDRRREAMAKRINHNFLLKCDAAGVREEFRKLEMKPVWMNRTQKWKDTSEDIDAAVTGCLAAQNRFDHELEFQSMKKELLSMFAKTVSAEFHLVNPVTTDDLRSPIGEIMVEDGKRILSAMAQKRAEQEALVKKHEYIAAKLPDHPQEAPKPAATAQATETEKPESPAFKPMNVVITLRAESEADAREINDIIERLPMRLVTDITPIYDEEAI